MYVPFPEHALTGRTRNHTPSPGLGAPKSVTDVGEASLARHAFVEAV